VTLAEVDWRLLRGALVLLTASLVVSAVVVVGSYQFWDAMDRTYRRESAKLLSIRSRYQTIDEEERLIEIFLPRYQALEARGVIGREQRLDWIETLRTASADLKLPELRYSINTQNEYQADFPLQTGAFQVYVSEMTLDLGLLHEGDLPALLDRLEHDATGLYRVSRCSIDRIREPVGLDPTQPNLRAACTLEWLTVKQPESEQPT
jgi:hypothetical protein